MKPPVPDAIQVLFSALGRAWRDVDTGAMRGLWAPGLAEPLYLAEEGLDFATTWDAFDAYWSKTRESIAGVEAHYVPLPPRPLDGDRFLVPFAMDWTVTERGGRQVAGSIRGVAVVRLLDRAYFEAYVEAPLAPVVYMRELYQFAAAARESGFDRPVGGSTRGAA